MSDDLNTLIADTLEMMALIERTEQVGKCLIWRGATSFGSEHPIYKPHGCPCTLVRRAMYRLNGGELIPRKPIDSRCGEVLCINPKHLFQSTIAKIAKKAAERGAFSSVARKVKIAAAKRKVGKLTMEQAREIRNSEESGPVLALRYGINKSLVNGIKRGDSWRDYSSPWAGLVRSTA